MIFKNNTHPWKDRIFNKKWGKMDIYMQKNETKSLSLILHKS